MNAQADCMLQDRKAQKCRYLTIGFSGEVYNQCCETLSCPICASVCYILSAGSTVEPANDTTLRYIRSSVYKKTKALKIFKKAITRQDKTRQDIYYHNITSTIFWHAVSKKTLVEACQINSITNQILHIISKKQRK